MGQVKAENPLITVCSTSYQVARTVDLSLKSVVKALNELSIDYEVVIIDNYSTDGTREKLLKWSREIPLRFYEYRCSRGLGRALCVRLARGKHILMIDLDRVYNSEALQQVITNYLKLQGIYPGICANLCPRDTLLKVNYRDLNRAEDVDLSARMKLMGIKRIIIPTGQALSRELRVGGDYALKKSLLYFMGTAPSELRYARNITEYLKREFRNKSDMLIGGAYSFAKFIREDYYVWLYEIMGFRRTPPYVRIPIMLLRSLMILPIMVINKLRRIKVYAASKVMSNHLHSFLMRVLMYPVSMAILRELGIVDGSVDVKKYVNDWLKSPEFIYAWTMYSHEAGRQRYNN